MPSGAKKRKAAKKKKGSQVKGAAQSRQPHSHGEEDLEPTYDKDSDGGDAGSPTSQDYHNCNDLIDQEDEEADKQEDDSSFDQPSTSQESKDKLEKGTTEQESNLQVERNSKVEDEEFQSMDIGIEIFETPKESHEASLLRSFSSCSNSNLKDGPNPTKKENIVVEDTPVVDSVKEVDLLSAMSEDEVEVEKGDELGLIDNGDSTGVVDKTGSLVTMDLKKEEDELVQTSPHQDETKISTYFDTQVNGEKVPEVHGGMRDGQKEKDAFQASIDNEVLIPEPEDSSRISGPEDSSRISEPEDSSRISKPVDSSRISEPEESATLEEGDALTLSYSALKIEADKDELVQPSQHQDETKTSTYFATQVNGENVPEVHGSMRDEQKEDEVFCTSIDNEARIPKLEDSSRISAMEDSSRISGPEDSSRISEPEDSSRMSELEDSATQEEGDVLTLSYSAPKIEASVEDADPVKDSKLTESSDIQHQNGLPIQPVQTSWKGCCGLLELFKGSNR